MLGLALLLVLGDEYLVEPLKEAPPQEIPEAVRKELAPAGMRVLHADKKPLADVWLRAALPLQDEPEQLVVKYTALKPGILVGAVRFHAKGADYKNQSIPAGLYTMRYGVQPEDGDHQGVSDTKDYLMLVPAASDASAETMAQEDLVKLSAKVTGKKHPSVLYLVKTGKEGDKLPRLVSEEEGKRWVLEAEVPSAAQGRKPLRLGLVLVGKSPDF